VADLLALARDRFGRAALATHALSLFQTKTDLYRRMHMLMQAKEPLARRCSMGWRLSYCVLLMVALVLAGSTFGLRRANAQAADADQKADERKLAEEKAAQADRQAELEKLRAEQDQIKAKLEMLELERQKLQLQLVTKGGKVQNDAAIAAQRALIRDQAVQKAKEAQAGELLAKIAAQNEDDALTRDKRAKDERQAMQDWVNKKPGGNREQNEFAGRAQLDLVSLANSYVDALGNLQLAELELSQLKTHFGPEEVLVKSPAMKIKVETARRKVRIFRSIAEAALEAAQVDFEIASRNVKMGLAPENSVMEAKSRLKVIEVILAQ
jgi:hypothetical protein